MLEETGNFWNIPGHAWVITTNGDVNSQGRAIMGRGIAKQAVNRFPGIDLQLGRFITFNGNRVHFLGPWVRADGVSHTIFSFPVKEHYNERASVELIKQSAKELSEMIPVIYERVVMVRPGCGNGGLLWEDVKPLLVPFLNNRFVIVNLPKTNKGSLRKVSW